VPEDGPRALCASTSPVKVKRKPKLSPKKLFTKKEGAKTKVDAPSEEGDEKLN